MACLQGAVEIFTFANYEQSDLTRNVNLTSTPRTLNAPDPKPSYCLVVIVAIVMMVILVIIVMFVRIVMIVIITVTIAIIAIVAMVIKVIKAILVAIAIGIIAIKAILATKSVIVVIRKLTVAKASRLDASLDCTHCSIFHFETCGMQWTPEPVACAF